MGRRLWLGALVAAVAATGTIGVDPAGAVSAPAVDQACTTQYQNQAAWAAPTESQSFTPTVHQLTGAAIRVLFVSRLHTTLPVRIVFHPTGDLPSNLEGPGYVVASAKVAVAGDPFTVKWFTVNFPSPVAVERLPLTGAYSLDVDFPLDLSFQPYGAHLGWAECDDYSAGRAYISYSPDSLNRSLQDTGTNTGLGPLPSDPIAGQADPNTLGFAFITYGR